MKKFLLLMFLCCGASGYAQQTEIPFESTILVEATDSDEEVIAKAAHVVPTANQLAALKNEFIAFVHFGPNTFTRMEWGNGKEDPRIFDLKELHTDQWCEAMRDAGMKMVVFTVKHHDGFVLWQSRYTDHGIMSTGYKDGKGDVLGELAASCRKYGLKLGIYLSPADLYQIESPGGLYGNGSAYTPRTIPREVPGRPFADGPRFQFVVDDYNEYFLNQLYELLTEYGPIHEVWFDGAHPKRRGGQTYNYKAWRELIRTLAPQATIFGREDVRWCGNEGGHTRESEWNVIAAYTEDPRTSDQFRDLYGDLGTREVLLKKERPYYLHYEPAETNTSIRAGWFYRDDTYQGVRNADDVFDIYERATGGNSIFLLNIPPNREGRFSSADVAVLKETGERIRETYGTDLLEGAEGPEAVLDGDEATHVVLDGGTKEMVFALPEPRTVNRLLLQEAVATHSERVERHAVDAWVDGQWKEVAQATNIGFKRILRFPDVTTDRLRVRILDSRLAPAISRVSAHYYRRRPPRVSAVRDAEGRVTLLPVQDTFSWANWTAPLDQRPEVGFPEGCAVYYTTDGSEPDEQSARYEAPFAMESGELKAVAFLHGAKGAVSTERFGFAKQGWNVSAAGGEQEGHPATAAVDENPDTFWQSADGVEQPSFTIDLGRVATVKGFAYRPPLQPGVGMAAAGYVETSPDGQQWTKAEDFVFGNLVNDPTKRYLHFNRPVEGVRHVRLVVTEITGGGRSVGAAEWDVF